MWCDFKCMIIRYRLPVVTYGLVTSNSRMYGMLHWCIYLSNNSLNSDISA